MKKMKQSTFNLLMIAIWGLNLAAWTVNLAMDGPSGLNITLIICSAAICVLQITQYVGNRKQRD